MEKDELFKSRYIAVKNAMFKAKNPEWKDLWKNVMMGLIKAEAKRKEPAAAIYEKKKRTSKNTCS